MEYVKGVRGELNIHPIPTTYMVKLTRKIEV